MLCPSRCPAQSASRPGQPTNRMWNLWLMRRLQVLCESKKAMNTDILLTPTGAPTGNGHEHDTSTCIIPMTLRTFVESRAARRRPRSSNVPGAPTLVYISVEQKFTHLRVFAPLSAMKSLTLPSTASDLRIEDKARVPLSTRTAGCDLM